MDGIVEGCGRILIIFILGGPTGSKFLVDRAALYWPYNLVHRPLLPSQMINLLDDSDLSASALNFDNLRDFTKSKLARKRPVATNIYLDSENNRAGLKRIIVIF